MEMTLREFIAKAQQIKPELLDKKVVVRAENGILMTPEIKFVKKDHGDLSLGTDNVEMVIITC